MNNELLPIGTLIELNDGKKLVIVSYVENAKHKISYLCGGYPSYFLIDLIPLSKKNEFIKKYKLSTPSSVQAALKGLLEKNLVSQEQNQYEIADKLLGVWLQKNY